MNTIRDTLIDQAITQAERDLISHWMSEEHDDLCARQRAWADVRSRGSWARLQFNW